MNCEEVVFTVAMNFLDRFLVNTDIRKNQLQLVGVVCLLIASKLRQTQNLEPNILSFFTDYSVTVQEIIVSIVCLQLTIEMQTMRGFKRFGLSIVLHCFAFSWLLYGISDIAIQC